MVELDVQRKLFTEVVRDVGAFFTIANCRFSRVLKAAPAVTVKGEEHITVIKPSLVCDWPGCPSNTEVRSTRISFKIVCSFLLNKTPHGTSACNVNESSVSPTSVFFQY